MLTIKLKKNLQHFEATRVLCQARSAVSLALIWWYHDSDYAVDPFLPKLETLRPPKV